MKHKGRSGSGYLKQNSEVKKENNEISFVILPRGTELPQIAPQRLPQQQSKGFRKKRSSISDKSDCSSGVSSSDDAASIAGYAGAGFHSPPSAEVLPSPPMHWTNHGQDATHPVTINFQLNQALSVAALTSHIKGLLKVPAQA